MDKIIDKLDPLEGVGIGQKAILNIKPGPRILSVTFDITATSKGGAAVTLADVLDVCTMKIGGKEQMQFKASELDHIQSLMDSRNATRLYNYHAGLFYGADGTAYAAAHAGLRQAPLADKQARVFFTVHFRPPWRKNYSAADMDALVTAWPDGSKLPSLSFEMNVPETGNLDDTKAFSIKATAETDDVFGSMVDKDNKLIERWTPASGGRPFMSLIKMRRNIFNYGGSGEFPITTLQTNGLLESMHLFGQDGDFLDAIKIKKDGRTMREHDRIMNDQVLIKNEFNEAALDPNVFDVVADYTDVPTDAWMLDGVRTFEVTPTLRAAAAGSKTLTVLSLVRGGLD